MSAWTCRHTDGKVVQKIVPPRPRIPWWKGPGADSEEKQEPASDINTALADSLKVLDLKGPIREADVGIRQLSSSIPRQIDGSHFAFVSASCVRPSTAFLFRLNAKPINPSSTKTVPATINQ